MSTIRFSKLPFSLLLVLAQTVLSIQPEARPAVAAPLRDLKWGQLQILHTTDVHGWFGGHLQEPSFSADWGDYVSFAHHLHKRANDEGRDLILVDTGDRIEGNGLYDGSDPKGEYTFDILKHAPFDVLCSGNHELYKANSSENEYNVTVPMFKDSYLASNLDIMDPRTGDQVPMAPRYRRFETKNQRIRILAFGFLFDFTGNANNTVVKPVEDTIKEEWFQKAIREEDIDLILVAGHVHIRGPEMDAIHKAIRGVQWDTPIAFLGGHAHLRDYRKMDSKSFALESGRYLETLGWLSIDGLSTGKTNTASQAATVEFSRLYIDNNLLGMYHHSGTNSSTFNTPHGVNVSRQIHSARKALQLDKLHGCAPTDLYVNRAPYPSNHSIFTWLTDEVFPSQLSVYPRFAKDKKKALVISNTGAMRFDIFRGPFTRDTEYLVSPFTSGLRFVPSVPLDRARRIIDLLNNEGPIFDAISEGHPTNAHSHLAGPIPEEASTDEQAQMQPQTEEYVPAFFPHGGVLETVQQPLMKMRNPELTPGYTTVDDAGKEGDDTIHKPIRFWNVPNVVQATVGFTLDGSSTSPPPAEKISEDGIEETVDLVYNEYIQPWILLALKYLGQNASMEETAVYVQGKSMTDIMVEWIKGNWSKDC